VLLVTPQYSTQVQQNYRKYHCSQPPVYPGQQFNLINTTGWVQRLSLAVPAVAVQCGARRTHISHL
jgi:hypothetical protein